MRALFVLAGLWLPLLLTACSGIETQPTDTAAFAAAGYKYYTWRSQPLKNTANSSDPLYLLDAMIRREVDAALADKGYVLDAGRARFSVDYLQAPGLLQGVGSWDASGGIDPIPSARPNRQIDQARVDNAHALAGVHETHNIALLFNDTGTRTEIWRVLITKIVENVNETDPEKLAKAVHQGIRKGLSYLPDAS